MFNKTSYYKISEPFSEPLRNVSYLIDGAENEEGIHRRTLLHIHPRGHEGVFSAVWQGGSLCYGFSYCYTTLLHFSEIKNLHQLIHIRILILMKFKNIRH